jgi:hypothetical protein
MSNIDLRNCVHGQKLRSSQGWILTYDHPLDAKVDYYDHKVIYPDGTYGTRTHSGHVYRKPEKRLPEDHDIVEILPMDATDPVVKPDNMPAMCL